MKNLEFPFKKEVLFVSKTQYMVQISCIKLEKNQLRPFSHQESIY